MPAATGSSLASPERIYIGGLDPPRLTAQDVLNRLPKNCGVEIHSVQSSLDKPYCHVTATSTATSSDKSTSALEVLFSTFNNVKWKGCRLIVQEARPHFLERLEQERRHRQLAMSIMTEPNDVDMGKTNPMSGTKESHIPRRLRVRKKFGDEAYHVDTKPWLVNDWSNFCRVIDKQRQKSEKREPKESRDSSLPVMHRAIHIRFDNHDSSNIDLHATSDKNANNHSSPLPTETSEDSSSESDESVSVRNEKEVGINKAEYTWSDDDDSFDQDVSLPNEGDEGSDTSESDEDKQAPTAKHMDRDPSREAQIGQDSVAVSASNPKSSHVKSQPGTYDWSSSDDDSIDHSQTVAMQRNGPFMLVTQSDEFDAGFDIHDTAGSKGETEEDDEEGVHDLKQDNADLSNDVSTNLGILSSLFPDMVDTQPALLDKDPDHGIAVNTKTTKAHTNTSGFGSSGIMLRYDPNDASTQQFEIMGPEDHGETNKDTEQLQDHHDPSADKEEANKMWTDIETPNAEPMVLYEEKKLEELFREAREGWKAGNKSDKPPNNGGEAAGGMFTFGFDLGQTAASVPKASVGFSFGFDLPQVIEEKAPNLGLADPKDKDPEVSSLPKLAPSTAPLPEKRRRGFLFSDDVITKYTTRFYSLNNGLEIMKDVEAYRQDPNVKEAWNKERHTLTIDWKRKQKHAQSRIQKKMKIR